MDTADLHLHSDRSDGVWPAARVVHAAKTAGLRAIALTDHDTLAGVRTARDEGERCGVEVLSGVEVSTWDGADRHVLGYGFDPDDPALTDLFERARSARLSRAAAIVEKLAALGKPIPLDSVLAEAGEGAVGRPHVARAMLRAGHVGSFREAFDVYLGDGKPAWAEKLRVAPADAVRLLHAAGGVAVAAHPGCYGGPEAVDALLDCGLDGVEAWHSLHDPEMTRRLEEYAAEHDLLVTGGSDFHGPGPGAGVGSVRVPYARVEELRERVDDRRAARRGGTS